MVYLFFGIYCALAKRWSKYKCLNLDRTERSLNRIPKYFWKSAKQNTRDTSQLICLRERPHNDSHVSAPVAFVDISSHYLSDCCSYVQQVVQPTNIKINCHDVFVQYQSRYRSNLCSSKGTKTEKLSTGDNSILFFFFIIKVVVNCFYLF